MAKKMTLEVYKKERTEYLMDKFMDHADHAKDLACAGYKFTEVQEAQLLAAKVWNDMNQEAILDKAVELYPQEQERLMDYKDIYNEFISGVKI